MSCTGTCTLARTIHHGCITVEVDHQGPGAAAALACDAANTGRSPGPGGSCASRARVVRWALERGAVAGGYEQGGLPRDGGRNLRWSHLDGVANASTARSGARYRRPYRLPFLGVLQQVPGRTGGRLRAQSGQQATLTGEPRPQSRARLPCTAHGMCVGRYQRFLTVQYLG